MISEIERYINTRDFRGIARRYETSVSAFCASTFVWQHPAWPGIVMAYARHPVVEAEIVQLITYLNQRWNGDLAASGITKLRGMNPLLCGGKDVVILLSGPFLQKMGTVDPALNSKTVFAVPAFEAEFSGQESTEEFDELIHGPSDIGNWRRQPPADADAQVTLGRDHLAMHRQGHIR